MTAIKNDFRPSAAMLMFAIRASAERRNKTLSWFLVACAVLLCTVSIAIEKQWLTGIGMGAVVPVAALTLMWGSALVFSLREQYGDYHALVPGMRQRAHRLIALVVVTSILVNGSVLVMAGLRPTVAYPVVVAGLIIVTLLFHPVAGRVMGTMLVADFVVGTRFESMEARVACVFASMIVGFFVVQRLARSPAIQKIDRSQLLMFKADSPNWTLYSPCSFADDCRSARLEPLLLQVVAPYLRLRWTVGIAVLTGCALVLLASVSYANSGSVGLVRGVVLVAVLGFQFQLISRVPRAIHRSRSEQSLLCLTAHMPSRPQLNRFVSTALLRQLLRYWIGTTILALSLLFVSGASPTQLLRLLPVFGLSLIPIGFILRDYSRSRKPRVWTGIANAGAMAVATLASLVAFSNRPSTEHWMTAGLVIVLLAAASLAFGWRRISNAAVVLPAGARA